MRAVVQRVSEASVTVGEETVAAIQRGFLILLGIAQGDTDDEVAYLARKIAGLRVFEDDAGKMNLALADVQGEVLVVSQFTLCADLGKGRRPSFVHAADPAIAEELYSRFCELVEDAGIPCSRGVFQAHMAVSLVNDGPVTLWLDTDDLMSG